MPDASTASGGESATTCTFHWGGSGRSSRSSVAGSRSISKTPSSPSSSDETKPSGLSEAAISYRANLINRLASSYYTDHLAGSEITKQTFMAKVKDKLETPEILDQLTAELAMEGYYNSKFEEIEKDIRTGHGL